MSPEKIRRLLTHLPAWSHDEITEEIKRFYRFPTARAAVYFASILNDVAEAVRHPPEIVLRRHEVLVRIKPRIGGLTENDLRLARLISDV